MTHNDLGYVVVAALVLAIVVIALVLFGRPS